MKKLILLFAAVAFVGCSSDDNDSTPTPTPTNSGSFKYDGTVFNLQPGLNMNDMVMEEVMEMNGDLYDRSTLSVTGLNGTSSSATIAFDLYYKTGTSIAGVYTIHDSEASGSLDFEDFIAGPQRACMGWISQGAIFNMATSTMLTGNNPTGTVEVIVNSPTNYTLKYNSNFRLYENGFDFVRNMPTEINVTQNVTITQN